MSELEQFLNHAFFKKSVGFDWLNLAEKPTSTYPPCNIIKTGDNSYVISYAIAGFGEDDIEIEVKDNILTVIGKVADNSNDKNIVYLHKGIATRQFKQSFTLDRFIEVQDATLSNGMLHINLVREVPEEAKPKRIEVKSDKPKLLLG